jgi:hypothetical protein
MAVVQLSDVVIPAVYTSYQSVNNIENSAFVTSGIVARNPLLDALADGPSNAFTVPYWKDLDQTIEVNYSNDDPADIAVPNKIGTGQWAARKTYVNQGWSSMDLVAELLGTNPMQRIRNRTGTYFQRQFNRRVIAMAVGVITDNIATNSGDMGLDVSIAAGNSAVAANKMSRSTFVAAAYTMGDAVEEMRVLAVHSNVMKTMVDNEEIDFLPDSAGGLTVPTFLGRRVIVDDTMPVVAGGTNGFVYTSILFGEGFAGFGNGTPLTPVEVDRVPASGNGGGQETLWERKTWLLHPFGCEWVEGSLAEMSPTIADLKLAAHWNRVLVRKNVPLAWIKTNG